MDSDIRISLTPEMYIIQIGALQRELEDCHKQIASISEQLEHERTLRQELENELSCIRDTSQRAKQSHKARIVTPETNAYSDFKSDGKRKAHAADSIRSYDDFCAIQRYYLDRGRIRDWAMWTIGVSLGLRVSDLLSLRFGYLIDKDKKTYLPRIQIYEQKTGKFNSCLITESVRCAMDRYLEAIKYDFDLDGYLFPSQKTKGKMYEECGWRILSSAGKALNLPLVIGSHTMRKSFANIAACVDKSCIDMNAITKIQGLLNHGDQRVTMKYLGTYQDMFDRARVAVSDFVLGKSGVNEIIAGNQYSTDDVVERLDALEKILIEKKEEKQC